MNESTVFESLVRERHSTRSFLSTPLTTEQIQAVLTDAQHAPSNCNTQPWSVHIVSGAKRDALSKALIEAEQEGAVAPDFSFDKAVYTGALAARLKASGKAHYDLLQIPREDQNARRAEGMRNFEFFGAPHVALLFMPVIGDSVRAAGDVGMYGQTFLLSLAARGLAGIPQTSLSMFAPTIRRVLGISNDFKMLFGISFGYADPHALVNRLDVGRVALDESVVFHS